MTSKYIKINFIFLVIQSIFVFIFALQTNSSQIFPTHLSRSLNTPISFSFELSSFMIIWYDPLFPDRNLQVYYRQKMQISSFSSIVGELTIGFLMRPMRHKAEFSVQ